LNIYIGGIYIQVSAWVGGGRGNPLNISKRVYARVLVPPNLYYIHT